jgi:hypothetical protein
MIVTIDASHGLLGRVITTRYQNCCCASKWLGKKSRKLVVNGEASLVAAARTMRDKP